MTIPPPWGSGTVICRKRSVMQASTLGFWSELDFVLALMTEPSAAMMNFTTSLPASVGARDSWRC